MISGCDFPAQAKEITAALVARVGKQIHSAAPIKFSVTKTQVNAADVDGVSLHGTADGKAVTADLYSFRVGLRFVSLVFRFACLRGMPFGCEVRARRRHR